jgi:hypothetical protein
VKQLTRILIFSMTAVVACAGSVQARDIFVNNESGDNRRDGSSAVMVGLAGGPCRSIGRALQLAKTGDRIIVAATGKPYRESITLQAGRHSGVERRPFEIIGNGAVLDGSQPVPRNVWRHVGDEVYRFRPSRMAYHNLFLDDKPVARKTVKRGDLLPKLEPLEWCLFDRHVYFRPEPGRIPRDYELSHTTLPVGISLYETRHVIIQDLVVQGFQLDGVNAHDSVFDATLVELTCRGNGRSGIAINGASRVKIIACLVGDNGTAQILADGFSHTEIINCNLLPKSAPSVVRLGGEVLVLKDGSAVKARRPVEP